MKRILVLGGGISGLATAAHLHLMAGESGMSLEVTVLEKDEVLGGKMRTTREDGYIVEWGPNGFLTNKSDTLDLVERLGISQHILPSSDSARKRFLYVGGGLVKLPESPREFLASPVLSVRGRLRVMLEPFIPPRKDDGDETLAQFARRRLGEEALEKLIEPMASGIYAGIPEEMSLLSCFPLIHNLEKTHGGLIRGMLKTAKERRKKGEEGMTAGPGGVLTSFDDGVFTLIEKIAENVPIRFETGVACESVEKNRDGTYTVRGTKGGEEISFEGDAVVVTVPAYQAAHLLENADGELSAVLSSIPYAPIAVVAAAYEKHGLEETLNGFGYLIPRSEGRKVLGVLFDSSIFHNRAPEGKALIRGMIGGARNPDHALQEEGRVVSYLLEEVGSTLGIGKDPIKIWFFRHEKGIPQYTADHQEKLKKIRARLRGLPGLYLNNNAYEGIGLNDCVRNSMEAAASVIDYLRGDR